MINIDLSGKSILLTGAMGAIARPMAQKLAAAGATLILVDIKPEDAALQTLQEWQIPSSSYVYFSTDITDSAALGRAGYGDWARRRVRIASLRHNFGRRIRSHFSF